MSAKLTTDDFRVLAAIRSRTGVLVPVPVSTNSSLFIFGLLSRRPSGELFVTEAGERALFQQAALSGLAEIMSDKSGKLDGAVQQWLLDAGFIKVQACGASLQATRLGATWLSSFQDEVPKARNIVDPGDFARRRNQAN